VIPKRISYPTLPEADCLRLSDFFTAFRAEVQPENPLIPFEEWLQRWRNPAKHAVSVDIVLEDARVVAGTVSADWSSDDTDNPETCWGYLMVAPDFRGRGFGSILLRRLLEEIASLGKSKFFVETYDSIPAGEVFAQKLGAKRGLEQNTNRLLLADLNREYVTRSLARAPTDLFELGMFDGIYPDDQLEALCELFTVMNAAPHGKLEVNDEKITPEQLRQSLEHERTVGIKRCLIFARDRATRRYAGFTEVEWMLSRPQVMVQNGTAVHADFRGHGLGAWLKAAMIERILRDHPEADQVRTSNAESNAPMVKINDALGFKLFLRRVVWQVDVQETLERLRLN
jgi:mycothiol synthase